jgi:hypothetical protein
MRNRREGWRTTRWKTMNVTSLTSWKLLSRKPWFVKECSLTLFVLVLTRNMVKVCIILQGFCWVSITEGMEDTPPLADYVIKWFAIELGFLDAELRALLEIYAVVRGAVTAEEMHVGDLLKEVAECWTVPRWEIEIIVTMRSPLN